MTKNVKRYVYEKSSRISPVMVIIHIISPVFLMIFMALISTYGFPGGEVQS